jgi:hypothetical protein
MRPVPPIIRVIRWFLAMVYLIYGAVKLAGGQFHHGDFTIDSRTVDGPFFVWAFFGWAKPYWIFAGLGELVPAILLLFRRTATVGALMLFPVALNITVMTFAFQFPAVKYASLGYTALLGVLIAHDLPRLWPVLVPDPPPPVTPFSRIGKAVLGVVGLPVALLAVTVLAESLSMGPERVVRDSLVARGIPADSLALRRSRYAGQIFGRSGFVEYQTLDSSRRWRAEIGRPISFVAWRVSRIDSVAP